MKRFTDTEKWCDPWYRKLPPELKLFWIYILDNCDHAGVWKCDEEVAQFIIGKELDWQRVKDAFKERLLITGEKWYIRKFIKFQYGNKLSEGCKPHRRVIELLRDHKILHLVLDDQYNVKEDIDTQTDKDTLSGKGSMIPFPDRAKDMDKDKDTDKEGGIVKGGRENYVREKYPEMAIVNMTKDEYERLVAQFGEEGTRRRIENLFLYIGSKGAKYKNHYLTILNWERKNHERAEQGNGKSAGGIRAAPGKYANVTEQVLNFDLPEHGM